MCKSAVAVGGWAEAEAMAVADTVVEAMVVADTVAAARRTHTHSHDKRTLPAGVKCMAVQAASTQVNAASNVA